MSLHKLTAGSGYTYLTRQVAALDATDKGGVGLASYYTARGETPGEWIGSGLIGVAGISAGDVVTPAQMQSLFGSGHHPLADEREADLEKVRTQRAQHRVQDRVRAQRETAAAGGRCARKSQLAEPITDAERREARRLGTPLRVYDHDISPFRIEVAKRLEGVNQAAGLPRDWPVPAADRARIRTEVAHEFFRTEHGRDAGRDGDAARELAATIAKHSRPKTKAVAGFDLSFSPVKSVSTLWAIAEPSVAAKIEIAHQAAVKDALDFIEKNALFTRTGANGVRQVDVTGLVATAFTHRDSRAGDPDLHTHVHAAKKSAARGLNVSFGTRSSLKVTRRIRCRRMTTDGRGVTQAVAASRAPPGKRICSRGVLSENVRAAVWDRSAMKTRSPMSCSSLSATAAPRTMVPSSRSSQTLSHPAMTMFSTRSSSTNGCSRPKPKSASKMIFASSFCSATDQPRRPRWTCSAISSLSSSWMIARPNCRRVSASSRPSTASRAAVS